MLHIDYNKFTDSELERINEAAWSLNYIFGTQFPDRKQQLDLLSEDEQFRAVNQIIIQSFNTLAKRENERQKS